MIEAEFQFLGTGASLGVPVIGCDCPTCTSPLPENKRLRTAATLKYQGKTLLIDAGTDFRQQALTHNIRNIDALILTHAHNDHVAGIDDLRALFIHRTAPIPTLMSKETHTDLKERYSYIFNNKKTLSMIPQFQVEELQHDRGECLFAGLYVKYFTYVQQGMKVLGLRFGDFAFVTDIKEFEESVIDDLLGVTTLVVSALRFTASTMHFTVDEAIAFSKRVGAKTTYLTHIGHEIEYEAAKRVLPEGVLLAVDGLKIKVNAKGVVHG